MKTNTSNTMSEETYPACPQCKSTNTYPDGELFICPDCFYEFDSGEVAALDANTKILDANGNELQNGDTVVVVKDLPVKGFSKAIKAGTKVKNIRLTDGDHNIDCKVDGFGAMALKSEFVKKAN